MIGGQHSCEEYMIQVVDFETTGLGTKEVPAQPIQFGQVTLYEDDFTICSERTNEVIIKPTIPIEWGAMGIHGITNEYVNKWLDFTYEEVSEGKWIIPETHYLVAHNAAYDTQFICPEQLAHVKVLCTLKLARKLIDKRLCSDHKNMTLFYYLGCYKDPIGAEHIGQSHSALSDATVTANILYAMLKQFNLTIEEAYQLANGQDKSEPENNDISVCFFKKHQGKLWKDVVKQDRDYVLWLLNGNKIQDKVLVDFVRGLL